MNRMTTIARLSIALLAGLSAVHAYAADTAAPTRHGVHKKHVRVITEPPIVIHMNAGEPLTMNMHEIAKKAGLKLASIDDPYSPDYQLPPEQAAAMVDMIYNDTAATIDYSNPMADMMQCNCTVYHQHDRPTTVTGQGIIPTIVQNIPAYDPVTPSPAYSSTSSFQSNGKIDHGYGAGNN